MSATCAPATWLSATSSARRSVLTLTVISASSRSTASPGRSSVTRSTLTSLCICFSICSSECSLQSTRSVSREMSGRSVGPTARLWMLYPRREKSCDTRASAPGRFSRRTEIVCELMGASTARGGQVWCQTRARKSDELSPGVGARNGHGRCQTRAQTCDISSTDGAGGSCGHRFFAGGFDDVDGGGAGGDHREALLLRVAADVDDGCAAGVERGGESVLELVLALDGEAGAAVRLGDLGVVGHRRRQVRLREALGVGHLLPLRH